MGDDPQTQGRFFPHIQNGSISGSLALANAISVVTCAWAGDRIQARKFIVKNSLRKFCTAMGEHREASWE